MIVRNESDVIARCLDSVRDIADEIIIVDTGSTDETMAICASYTGSVFDFQWIDDFAAARNFSFSKATMDYVMWLDADDVLLETDRMKLLQLKENMDQITDTVMMKYNVAFDHSGNVTTSYYRERMVKRQLGCTWHEPVHEYMDYSGNILFTDICVTHMKNNASSSDRNIRIYEGLIESGKEFSPRGQYYYARELFYHQRYEDAVLWFEQFLRLKHGCTEDNIAACCLLSQCYSALNDFGKALQAAVKSLEYGSPRADICCQIGLLHFDRGEYEKAIVWYQLAAAMTAPDKVLGIILHDCYGFIPNIQLCVCHDRLGTREEAVRYNEIAAAYKPGDEAVEHNRAYFNSIINSGN